MHSDEELQYLRDFQKREHRAMEILVDEYYPALLNFLIRMGCPPGDVDDIIQETFIKAARGLYRYQHRDRFRIWLFKICHNSLRDYYKRPPGAGKFHKIQKPCLLQKQAIPKALL